MAEILAQVGWQVTIRHRELERRAIALQAGVPPGAGSGNGA
jgi:hypothetical protein